MCEKIFNFFSTSKPHRLVWQKAKPEAPQVAEKAEKKESVQQIYEQLVSEKSSLEGKRGNLGAKMYDKLSIKPSVFSPDLLRQMAGSKRLMEDVNIRSGIAGNEHTPTDILLKLATDKEGSVRSNVAENSKVPKALRIKILKELAVSKDYFDRSFAASNPLTPSNLLMQLANDSDVLALSSLIDNPAVPTKALQIIASRDDIGVDPYNSKKRAAKILARRNK